jgi:hypothetical protein
MVTVEARTQADRADPVYVQDCRLVAGREDLLFAERCVEMNLAMHRREPAGGVVDDGGVVEIVTSKLRHRAAEQPHAIGAGRRRQGVSAGTVDRFGGVARITSEGCDVVAARPKFRQHNPIAPPVGERADESHGLAKILVMGIASR